MIYRFAYYPFVVSFMCTIIYKLSQRLNSDGTPPPPKVRFRNNKSALSSAEFVTNEIKDLLESGCIKEIAESEAHVISPFSVVHKPTKPRLILDLSYFNQFLTVPKFKFEDIRSVRDLFIKVTISSDLTFRKGITKLICLNHMSNILPFLG